MDQIKIVPLASRCWEKVCNIYN